jgi:hypothetical protein
MHKKTHGLHMFSIVLLVVLLDFLEHLVDTTLL